MEDMDGTRPAADERLTVGQVAQRFGVTVRTLRHYDDVGLLTPGERSAGGYRLYTAADLLRLRHVVVYRRLGFSLGEIERILAAETRRPSSCTCAASARPSGRGSPSWRTSSPRSTEHWRQR